MKFTLNIFQDGIETGRPAEKDLVSCSVGVPPASSNTVPVLVECRNGRRDAARTRRRDAYATRFIVAICAMFLGFGLRIEPRAAFDAQENPTGAGSLDTSFFAAMGVSPAWDGTPTVRRILLQPDGQLLIRGGFDQVQGYTRHGLARLLTSGSLDRSFVPAVEYAWDLALEPDGKIVVADPYSGLVRLHNDGTRDTTFDGTMTGGATAVIRLPGGEFLAGIRLEDDPGQPDPQYGIAWLDAQGHLSSNWHSQYRSPTPVSFILLEPGRRRIVVDGVAVLDLNSSGHNFTYLTNDLPGHFQALCGVFQPNGQLLLGRSASSDGVWNTNATFHNALVRLNPDGTLDPGFSTNLSIGLGGLEGGWEHLRIDALALQPDGKILIGGFFTRVNGQPRSLVARLLPNGELDTEFVPDLEVNPNGDIDALQTVSSMSLTLDNKLLLGGVFTRINGLECHTLARLHTSPETSSGILKFAQSAYYAWETNGTLLVTVLRTGPTNRPVSVFYEAPDLYENIPVPGPQRGHLVFDPGETQKSIRLPIEDNRLLNGNQAFHLVLSNPSGGAVLTTWLETKIVILDDEQVNRPGSVDLNYPALNLEGAVYNVTALAVELDGSVLLSVQATTNYWTYQPLLLRLNPDGVMDPEFHPAFDQAVTSAFPDPVTQKILVTGGFSQVNGQARTNLARLNHDGTLDTAFQVVSDNWISGAVVEADGKIMIYGHFNLVNGVPRRQLARLFPNGSVDPEFDTSNLSWIGTINCLASQTDGKIVLGGFFNQIQGVSRTNLARLNRNGSLDTSFVPVGFNFNPSIFSLVCQPDGKLLAGGNVESLDGRGATVIRLLDDGSRDLTFRDGSPSYAHGRPLLLQSDGKIVVDGLWRLNNDGSRDYSYFTDDEFTSVNAAILMTNGDLLLSGGFSTFNQWPRPFLVRLRGGNAPVYGFFEFVESSFYAEENAGAAFVRIRRAGPPDEAATVHYATSDALARTGIDYVAVSGALEFASGETEKSISIPLINNEAYQNERYFNVTLTDTTPGLRSPSAWPAPVYILDDDPGLSFTRTNYWVDGHTLDTNGGLWRLDSVRRHGDLDQPLTVQCQLEAGTAVPGQDFIATNLTLEFAPYQFEVPVLIPLLRNAQNTSRRTLDLVLAHPQPNISLATDARARLTILGKPEPPGFVPGSSTVDPAGHFHLQCDLWPGQIRRLQASTNLVDWIDIGWVYHPWETEVGSAFFEDTEAWKYPLRFYLFPQNPTAED